MKLAIIGYGRMGRIIADMAPSMGHEVVLTIDRGNLEDFSSPAFAACDAAIEFTTPETAFENICRCLEASVPVVCGTTGWLSQFPEAVEKTAEHRGALFYASNYSIGVNILFAMNRQLARLMNAQPAYEVAIEEIHHIHKLDAPSGTAITLAQGILAELDRKTHWAPVKSADPAALCVHSHREGEVPGTHEVIYRSPVDTLTLRHEAHSRAGFAHGALLAAAWIAGKKGVFGMNDLLGITQ